MLKASLRNASEQLSATCTGIPNSLSCVPERWHHLRPLITWTFFQWMRRQRPADTDSRLFGKSWRQHERKKTCPAVSRCGTVCNAWKAKMHADSVWTFEDVGHKYLIRMGLCGEEWRAWLGIAYSVLVCALWTKWPPAVQHFQWYKASQNVPQDQLLPSVGSRAKN